MELNIYRITQELLNNAIKHSHASEIKYSLTVFDQKVSIYYFDNGVGFEKKNIKNGSGITNIKERVRLYDVFFKIINSSENKTIIELDLFY